MNEYDKLPLEDLIRGKEKEKISGIDERTKAICNQLHEVQVNLAYQATVRVNTQLENQGWSEYS